MMNTYYLILFLIFILLGILQPPVESFKLRRRRPGHKIQIGTLNNTPTEIKSLMVGLNKVGGQLVEDARYDTVADDYLDKDNVQ